MAADGLLPAVVAGQDDEGVVRNSLFFQRFQHTANFQVEPLDHPDKGSAGFFLRRIHGDVRILERRMRCLEGEEDEEGVVARGLDEADRFIGKDGV